MSMYRGIESRYIFGYTPGHSLPDLPPGPPHCHPANLCRLLEEQQTIVYRAQQRWSFSDLEAPALRAIVAGLARAWVRLLRKAGR